MYDFATMTYVTLNEQVTLQNQDPICNKIQSGVCKSFLIDLEALTNKTSVTREKP